MVAILKKPLPVTETPARSNDTAERLRRVPGIDVDAGLAFVGNSVDVYLRLLHRFVQLHEADMHDLVHQAEGGDHASVTGLAHAIKGGAATLGLTGLSGLAQQLEQEAGAQTPVARIVELARALQVDHAVLRQQLAGTVERRA